jgi:hypothetical protein
MISVNDLAGTLLRLVTLPSTPKKRVINLADTLREATLRSREAQGRVIRGGGRESALVGETKRGEAWEGKFIEK